MLYEEGASGPFPPVVRNVVRRAHDGRRGRRTRSSCAASAASPVRGLVVRRQRVPGRERRAAGSSGVEDLVLHDVVMEPARRTGNVEEATMNATLTTEQCVVRATHARSGTHAVARPRDHRGPPAALRPDRPATAATRRCASRPAGSRPASSPCAARPRCGPRGSASRWRRYDALYVPRDSDVEVRPGRGRLRPRRDRGARSRRRTRCSSSPGRTCRRTPACTSRPAPRHASGSSTSSSARTWRPAASSPASRSAAPATGRRGRPTSTRRCSRRRTSTSTCPRRRSGIQLVYTDPKTPELGGRRARGRRRADARRLPPQRRGPRRLASTSCG